MTAVCPNGHPSAATDYCDVCGTPMGPAAARSATGMATPGQAAPSATPSGAPTEAPTTPTPPEQPDAEDCPNCGAANPPGALFCEACGYDFTTGAMPRGATPNQASSPTSTSTNTPAPATPAAAPAPSGAAASPSGTAAAEGSQATSGSPSSQPTSSRAPSSTSTPGSPATLEWVAEVWVDPDWYRTQEVDDPCPSPGLPIIVPLTKRSILLGRVSASRNTHPEIDLSADPGVSRRHAQLTSDGTRWFVEDLKSSNGTFVAPAAGPMPADPIPVGPKTELGDDDRLYVGAWTRLVVREATPDERGEEL